MFAAGGHGVIYRHFFGGLCLCCHSMYMGSYGKGYMCVGWGSLERKALVLAALQGRGVYTVLGGGLFWG